MTGKLPIINIILSEEEIDGQILINLTEHWTEKVSPRFFFYHPTVKNCFVCYLSKIFHPNMHDAISTVHYMN